MKQTIFFDVLIVYNEKYCVKASNNSLKSKTPFSEKLGNESYNIVYNTFLKTCKRLKVKVAFVSSADIIGPGLGKSFWDFKNGKWLKVNAPCFSNLIFDKFAPTDKKIKSHRDLLFSKPEIEAFNSPYLFELFFDKQKTYDRLAQYSIPTISLPEKTTAEIKAACTELKQLIMAHDFSDDFSTDIIMKDEFGAGGENVYKFKRTEQKKILETMEKNKNVSFVLQPFLKFDQGFSYNNLLTTTDIRFVYLAGKIVQSYIRVAQDGDFRCNEHLGGILTYLNLDKIPPALTDRANLIAAELDDDSSLYALDFIVSNNKNIYFLEGNTMPGLDWNMALKKNEREAKKLIELVVKEIIKKIKVRKIELPSTNLCSIKENLLPSLIDATPNYLT